MMEFVTMRFVLTLFSFLVVGGHLVVTMTTPPPAEDVDSEQTVRDLLQEFRDEVAELQRMLRVIHSLQSSRGAQSENQSSELMVSSPPVREVSESLLTKLRRNRRNVNSSLSTTYTTNDSHGATGGVIYTHWGQANCSDGAELVYTGSVAGAYATHDGSGSNYLCMPMEPIYDQFETSAHAKRGLLYSTEFETNTAPVYRELHDQTPTCAVCRAPPNRLTKLMIPGRNVCPSQEWRLEYKGYLMSGLYTHKKTEFICMDGNATALPGTTGSQDGGAFYMVESRCLAGGGMPCGPYVNGYELTCAVCTI
ncbi:uncharacterized protein [Diadema antillarum]|uniref:uncharacterized protein n=1 Tax=Diadema antillarum TaxID=105358 RepID=UPI003A884B8C